VRGSCSSVHVSCELSLPAFGAEHVLATASVGLGAPSSRLFVLCGQPVAVRAREFRGFFHLTCAQLPLHGTACWRNDASSSSGDPRMFTAAIPRRCSSARFCRRLKGWGVERLV
jgi:hypothetical protein